MAGKRGGIRVRWEVGSRPLDIVWLNSSSGSTLSRRPHWSYARIYRIAAFDFSKAGHQSNKLVTRTELE